MNNVEVFALMAGLTALFVSVGGYLGAQGGRVTALLLAGGANVFMHSVSDEMVLGMYRARVVSEGEAPELHRMVDRPRQRAGLQVPTVAIASHEQPNAFATGRHAEHTVVRATAGLMKLVYDDELRMAGVISNLAWFGMFASGVAKPFSTHTPTAEPGARLQAMSAR